MDDLIFVELHAFLSTSNCLTSCGPPAGLQGMAIPSLQTKKLSLIEGSCLASKVLHSGHCQKSSVRETNAERSPKFFSNTLYSQEVALLISSHTFRTCSVTGVYAPFLTFDVLSGRFLSSLVTCQVPFEHLQLIVRN